MGGLYVRFISKMKERDDPRYDGMTWLTTGMNLQGPRGQTARVPLRRTSETEPSLLATICKRLVSCPGGLLQAHRSSRIERH